MASLSVKRSIVDAQLNNWLGNKRVNLKVLKLTNFAQFVYFTDFFTLFDFLTFFHSIRAYWKQGYYEERAGKVIQEKQFYNNEQKNFAKETPTTSQ